MRKWRNKRSRKKEIEYKMLHVKPRKLGRSVAKANMRAHGIQRVNKVFRSQWKKYVQKGVKK